MAEPDLNLLVALNMLLAEASVAGAARRLGLSASAMSRTLSRLRAITADPLLVRAGRQMVLTPYAEEIRTSTQSALFAAQAILRPCPSGLNLATLEQTFTLCANEGFVEAFGASLIAAVASAPRVQLRFAPKSEKTSRNLREGKVDLEIGVLGEMGPEIRLQALFRDRFVGIVRRSHPLASEPGVTPDRYVAYGHVVASRRGSASGPVDKALAEIGLQRRIAALVPSFSAALSVALASDLIALAPASYFFNQPIINGSGAIATLCWFELPVKTPEITVSQMWHPRAEADPAHRWLRQRVLDVCGQGSRP